MFLLGLYTVVHKLVSPNVQAGYSSTVALLLFIGGLILLSLGIIGEYIGRIYMCINRSPLYVVRRVENSRGPE